jgi:RHS repeat-associated protein
MRSYAIADGNHTAAPIASLTTTYEYTGYERTRESVTAGDTLQQRRTYHYDPFGRLHQLDELEGTATRTTNILYDANGNMLSRSDADDASASEYFDYDPWDHMTAMHEGAAAAPPVARYEYDPSGMRIRELGTSRGDVEAFYADGALLEERTPLGALVSHYHEGPLGTLRFDGGDGEVSYFHMDASGSTMALTGAAGATNQTTTLDPWGAVESQTGTSGNRELFTGHRTDTETGLVYMGSRYYDPALGQFTTADSYLGEPSEPGSMQRYMYANANPGRYWDPDGHAASEMTNRTSMSYNTAATRGEVTVSAAYEPSLDTVGVDPTKQRASMTHAASSALRPMVVSAWEVTQLDWRRAYESFNEASQVAFALTVGVGAAAAAAPVVVGAILGGLAVVGALALTYAVVRQWDNAVEAGVDNPISQALFVGLGSPFGIPQMFEALSGRDALTGGAMTQEERSESLVQGAGAIGDSVGGMFGGIAIAEVQSAVGGVRSAGRVRAAGRVRPTGRVRAGRVRPGRIRAGQSRRGGRARIGTRRVGSPTRVARQPECTSVACLTGNACFVAGTLVAMSSIAQALPIDEVEVGSRVEVTAEAEALCSHEAREGQVRVSFVFNDERLTWDTIYLTRLMPRAEAESLGYEVGGSAWIDGAEFGSTGWAEIASIDPVDVPAGDGCVVHATNLRSSGDMIHLRLSDGTQVDGTATHRFWSVTRGDWFAARDLRVGESLRTPSGTVRVDEARVEAVLTPVFNLEVEGAHEFFVGDAEVLAHNGGNACPGVRRYQVGTYAGLRPALC